MPNSILRSPIQAKTLPSAEYLLEEFWHVLKGFIFDIWFLVGSGRWAKFIEVEENHGYVTLRFAANTNSDDYACEWSWPCPYLNYTPTFTRKARKSSFCLNLLKPVISDPTGYNIQKLYVLPITYHVSCCMLELHTYHSQFKICHGHPNFVQTNASVIPWKKAMAVFTPFLVSLPEPCKSVQCCHTSEKKSVLFALLPSFGIFHTAINSNYTSKCTFSAYGEV